MAGSALGNRHPAVGDDLAGCLRHDPRRNLFAIAGGQAGRCYLPGTAWVLVGQRTWTILKGLFSAELRELVGPEIPIVVLARSSQAAATEPGNAAAHATAAFYCHEYPHVDGFDRGEEIIETAAKVLRGEIAPVMHLRRLPLIIPPSTTLSGPAKVINKQWLRQLGAGAGCDRLQLHPRLPPHRCLRNRDVGAGDPRTAILTWRSESRMTWRSLSSPRLILFRQELPGAGQGNRSGVGGDRPACDHRGRGIGQPGRGRTRQPHALAARPAGRRSAEYLFRLCLGPSPQSSHATLRQGRRSKSNSVALPDELHGAPIVATAYVNLSFVPDGRFVLVNPMGAGGEVNLGKMARLSHRQRRRAGGVAAVTDTGRATLPPARHRCPHLPASSR